MTTSDVSLSQGGAAQALYSRILELETAIQQIRLEQKLSQAPGLGEISNPDRMRMFIDSNIVAIHRGDIRGNVLELNEATVKLLGYSKEDFQTGRVTWKGITPLEYAEVDANSVRQLKERGTTDFFEKEYIRKDGTRVPVMLHITALDREGLDCMVFVIDLSERKRFERELKESESQYRLLAEAIPQIVWMSYPSGRIKYANQRFYDFSGYKREDDDGLLWLNMLHPDDRSLLFIEAQQASDENRPFNMEVRYRAADGQYRWFLVRAIAIKDAGTNKMLWFGTSTDIDDKKRFAEELQESEARFSTLLDAIPQIVFTTDKGGDIDFFNSRWFEYMGLTKEQSEAGAWQLLLHPDDLPKYLSGWQHALQTGDSYETEFRLRRAVGTEKDDKAYRWHLGKAVALREADGSIAKWFATWTEIDSQKHP